MKKFLLTLYRGNPIATLLIGVLIISGIVYGIYSLSYYISQTRAAKEREQLRGEVAALLLKNELLDKETTTLNDKLKLRDDLILALNKRGTDILKEIKLNDQETERQLQAANDPIDPCERLRNLCAKLKLPNCECTAASSD